MSVSTGDILRLTLSYVLPQGVVAQNIFHYRYDGPLTIPDANVVDDFGVWVSVWATILKPRQSTIAFINDYQVSKRELTGNFVQIGGEEINEGGLATSDMLPHGVAGLIRAAVIGSSGQGRKFIPTFVETGQTDGIWDTTDLGILALLATHMVINPADILGISNDYSPGVYRPASFEFASFSGTTFVNAVCNYQRRRRPGVGT